MSVSLRPLDYVPSSNTHILNSIEEDIEEDIDEDEDDNSFFNSLTPCSSNLTLSDTLPLQLCDLSISNPLSNPLITLILPDLSSRISIPFSYILSYMNSLPSLPFPILAQDITIHHLLIYLFQEKLIGTSSSYQDTIKYINQIKLIHMGKDFTISNVIDISFPASIIDSYYLLPLLVKSPIFQVSFKSLTNIIPFELSINQIHSKLFKIIKQSKKNYHESNSQPNINTDYIDHEYEYSATYAEAVYKHFKKARRSISNNSKSRKQSIISIDSNSNTNTNANSTNNNSSFSSNSILRLSTNGSTSSNPIRTSSNSSETEVDDTSNSNTKPIKNQFAKVKFKKSFKKFFNTTI